MACLVNPQMVSLCWSMYLREKMSGKKCLESKTKLAEAAKSTALHKTWLRGEALMTSDQGFSFLQISQVMDRQDLILSLKCYSHTQHTRLFTCLQARVISASGFRILWPSSRIT